MLLTTERLVICTVEEPKFDRDVGAIVCVNGIFLNSHNVTEEEIINNPVIIQNFGSPIGIISMGGNGWIDYLVVEKHQRKGYATEALRKVADYSKMNGVEPFLVIDADNIASIKVAEKCGFKRVTQNKYYII